MPTTSPDDTMANTTTTKNPKRSMISFKNHVEGKAKSMDDFVARYQGLGHEAMEELKKRIISLENQFTRMETAWKAMWDDLDDDLHTALEKMYSDTKVFVDKTLDAAWKAMSDRSLTPGGGQTNVKIDDTLRPQHELLRSFTLEEANIWFDSFVAYYNHNKMVLDKLEAKVRRQLLYNSIEAAMALALQTDETIKDDNSIVGERLCLKKLKDYFMEKNPLFLRQHRFQQCQQVQNETVAEWWVRKKAKACECGLDKIKT